MNHQNKITDLEDKISHQIVQCINEFDEEAKKPKYERLMLFCKQYKELTGNHYRVGRKL